MPYKNPWLCNTCSIWTGRGFEYPVVAQYISQITCGWCGSVHVKHQCSQSAEPIWLKLLESSVPALCPWCGPVYGVGKQVARSPQFSPEVKELAGLACGIFLLVAALKWAKKLSS